jgi:zinc D-Ala-D-Ala dipeptidase
LKQFILIIAIFLSLSCTLSVREVKQNKKNISNLSETPSDTIIKQKKIYPGIEKLTDIQSLDSTILIDLKYAGTDNFMKQQLYFEIDRVYLQKDVALRLVKVQKYLKTLRPDLTLLIYDGVRPLSVQKAMWKALDTIPVKERTKFVSNPANGSIHNYGAAIDLTLASLDGKALDMGAGYDDIRKIAYPSLEAQFLKSGQLTKAQVDNRKLLRKVMKSQAFSNISTEWWHFNACSREQAKLKYAILE